MSLRADLQLPKEHGSWGMFFIPLTLGLIASGCWNWQVLLFIVAATAGFLVREPFMMAWRGWRRKAESGRAPRMVAFYAGVAILAGSPLLPSRPWLSVLAVAGATLYVWHAEASMRGEGRSMGAELLAMATSMLVAPAAVYVCTDEFGRAAVILWLMTFGYFAGAVFYVKMRLIDARARDETVKKKARRQCMGYHLVLALCAAGLPRVAAVGYLPVILRAFWYAMRPTREVNLKQVGWTEVLYSLVFLVSAAIAFIS